MQALNGSFNASFNRSFTKKHPFFYKRGPSCNLAPPPCSLVLHCSLMFYYFVVFVLLSSPMFCYFMVFRYSFVFHCFDMLCHSSLFHSSIMFHYSSMLRHFFMFRYIFYVLLFFNVLLLLYALLFLGVLLLVYALLPIVLRYSLAQVPFCPLLFHCSSMFCYSFNAQICISFPSFLFCNVSEIWHPMLKFARKFKSIKLQVGGSSKFFYSSIFFWNFFSSFLSQFYF